MHADNILVGGGYVLAVYPNSSLHLINGFYDKAWCCIMDEVHQGMLGEAL